ncbi:hypothetical protein [Brevundimonas vesicularis]|uniref:hypothetical protein n=1 Tax=Brevundimonas vesicularis TaxID=41276 RepID=UPI00384EADC4
MPVADAIISLEGEDEVVLLPDWASFGPDVDVVLTREGDVITIRPKTEKSESGDPTVIRSS